MSQESYSVSQTARLLGVSAPTVRRMAAEGELESFRTPGHHLRITRESLEAARSGNKERRDSLGPSSVLRNRREHVEELSLEAQELRAKREIEKLHREQEEQQAELEAQERQADREAEAAQLRLERVRIQQERERERHEAERRLQAFHTRWLREAEKFLQEFRFRLDHPWLSHSQRRAILNACEVEIANRQMADELLMSAVIERTVNATIEPWEQMQRIVELQADAARVALWKLPSGATEQEKAQAASLIRQSLKKLPASAADFELRASAEEAIAPLCCAIERRKLVKEVTDLAVRELPWEATDADKNNLRRECIEALAELPADISEAEAREHAEELAQETSKEIEDREADRERERRKAQQVNRGVQEVFSYLLELKRDGKISSDELWDSTLRQQLEQAVQNELADELSGDEGSQEVEALARDIIDDGLGVEPQ